MEHPCDTANLGLSDDELAGLTGFSAGLDECQQAKLLTELGL